MLGCAEILPMTSENLKINASYVDVNPGLGTQAEEL